MKKKRPSPLSIDPYALDRELQRQATLMEKYAEQQAEARFEYDTARAALDLCKAKVELAIRSQPAKHGITKVTEATVSAAVLLNPDYQAALEHQIQTKYEYELASGIVSALDHKKRSLQGLVSLFGMDYFSNPNVTTGMTQEVESYNRKATVKKRRRTDS